MCVSHAGHILVFLCKLCKVVHYVDELSAYYLQSITHDDNVGVVAYIARSCSEVDNACRIGTSLAVCINMSHNVMADFLFARLCHVIVDVVYVLLKLLYLSLGNRQSELHFSSCKSDPEFSPCCEFLVSRENILHFLACISCTEWAFIAVIVSAHFNILLFFASKRKFSYYDYTMYLIINQGQYRTKRRNGLLKGCGEMPCKTQLLIFL